MKLVRILLISLAAIVVVMGICAVVAFDAGFQTWAIHRALARRPELHLTVGRVAAGFHRVELQDVAYAKDGLQLRAPAVTIDLPVLTAALSRRMEISQVTARGWTIEIGRREGPLTPPGGGSSAVTSPAEPPAVAAAGGDGRVAPPASAPPSADGFHGLFSRLQLPIDVELDNVDLVGRIIFMSAGGYADVHVSNGGLAAGKTARFTVRADAAFTGAVKSLAVAGAVTAAMDTARTFTEVGLKLETTASGPQLGRPVTLDGEVNARRTGTAERYAVIVEAGDRKLATVNAEFPARGERITGDWKLDVRNGDLAPFLMGRAVPTFTAVGHGRWDTDPRLNDVKASGELEAMVNRLAALSSNLSGIGEIRIKIDANVAQRGDVTAVTKLDAAIANDRPVATLRALQAFEFNGRTGELRATNPAAELIGIVLQGVPLGWARPFAPNLALEGDDVHGEFAATPRAGGFSVRSKVPMTVSRMSVALSGKPLVHAVDVSISTSGDYTPDGWQAELSGFAASTGGPKVLLLNAKAGRLAGAVQPVKATGLLSVDLGALFTQPMVHDIAAVGEGSATIDFAATLGSTKEVQAAVAVRNLSAGQRGSKPPLPTIDTNVRASLAPDGTLSFNAPVTLERGGRKSDVTVNGSVKSSTLAFDARVTSSSLVVDDIKSLAVLLSSTSDKSGSDGRAAPPWSHLNGTVSVQLKKLEYSGTFEMSNVSGTLRIADGALKFNDVHAAVGEGGDVRVNGTLSFDSAAPRSFSAGADIALTDFDPSPLFIAGNPGQPPTVDGKFTITTEVTARAATIGQLPQAAVGDFEVTSRGGVFRGLPVNVGNLVENSSKLASWLASAGNAITSLAGRKDYDDITSRSQAANELAKILSAIPYDQFGMVVSRDEAFNLKVKELTLISPEIRITGSGRARGGPGSSVLNDVVDLDLRLRARGRPAELMKYLGVLDSKPDDLGYAACTIPVKVEGSLSKLDTTQLSNRLVALAVEKTGLTEKAVDWINRLRGKGPN